MNWKLFDHLRRNAAPPQRAVMEAYQQGRISRRNFVQRGTIVGLSVPTLGAVLAACGGDDDDADAPAATDAPADEPADEPAAEPRPAARSRSASSRATPTPASTRSTCSTSALTVCCRRASNTSSALPPTAASVPRHSPPSGRRTRTPASGPSPCVRASPGRTATRSRRPTWPRRSTVWPRSMPVSAACGSPVRPRHPTT